jgi:hypothetical protein
MVQGLLYGLCAGPIFHGRRCLAGVVRRHGSSIGSSRVGTASGLPRDRRLGQYVASHDGTCSTQLLTSLGARGSRGAWPTAYGLFSEYHCHAWSGSPMFGKA